MGGSGTGTKITYAALATDIANIALVRLGANTISSINDGSPNASHIMMVWDYVRSEVLQLRDWRFAKMKAELTRHPSSPLYGYAYAYALPNDFLRLVRPRRWDANGEPFPIGNPGIVSDYGLPVHPPTLSYSIELIPEDLTTSPPTPATMCLLTDYDDSHEPIIITYIRDAYDESRWTPAFKTCMAYRLAMEIAVIVTESMNKAREMERLFMQALYSASAINESGEHVLHETGSRSWLMAGRC